MKVVVHPPFSLPRSNLGHYLKSDVVFSCFHPGRMSRGGSFVCSHPAWFLAKFGCSLHSHPTWQGCPSFLKAIATDRCVPSPRGFAAPVVPLLMSAICWIAIRFLFPGS